MNMCWNILEVTSSDHSLWHEAITMYIVWHILKIFTKVTKWLTLIVHISYSMRQFYVDAITSSSDHCLMSIAECDVSVSKLLGFKTFLFFGGFGFGIEKIWYRKKYRIWYWKNQVSEKVSDSVSEKFRIWFC